MAFTDEDIIRLKASATQKHSTSFDSNSILSLLTRLEAAEYALMRMSIMAHMYTQGMKEAVESWRKSKGENK